MNAKHLNVLLFAAAIGLALFSYRQSQTIDRLEREISDAARAISSVPAPAEAADKLPAATDARQSAAEPVPSPAAPVVVARSEPRESAGSQRVMRDFAKMLDNPQMNEIMRASQRATLEVMYKELLDSYGLSPEERTHFMDMLMTRQMFRVETSMKMMGGEADPEEMKLLGQEMKDYDAIAKKEIDTFLNNPEDAEAFDYYEKTLQERMALSGLKASLAKAQMPLTDGADKELVRIMADQKKVHAFKSDLGDESNFDLGPERFRSENIEAYDQDLAAIHAAVAAEAAALLSHDQLEALRQTLEQMRQMQISQLKMASSMFAPKPAE